MIVDSHCHLDFKDFKDCQDELVSRASDAGVGILVTIGTRVRKFEETHSVAKKFENVYCSVGTHPHYADEETDVTTEELIRLANHEKVVAIGESGLDFYRNNSPRDIQEKGFRNHIAAVRETALPLVIHSRSADKRMMEVLEEEMGKGKFPAVFHCFSSSRELAMFGIDMGMYVSFSGILTFGKSDELREIAADLPSERILVETDAPYLAPKPFRGKRNEPSYVTHTAQALAEVRGVSFEEISEKTTENFHRLFWKVPKDDNSDD